MNEEKLFPEDMEELVVDEDEIGQLERPEYYKGAPAFDKDFIRDGQNRIKSASGVDSWKQWCMNCLTTQRHASPLYSSDFGIAISEIMAASTREEAESLFRAEVKEALEADPYQRTDYVGAVDFHWEGDSVSIEIEVVGIDGASVDFEVTLGR